SVSVEPLTPGLWPAFEDLFGKQGACYGCWCTHFRLPPAVRRGSTNQRNKDYIRARVEVGPPPGLLAMEDGRALGGMPIGPPIADGEAQDPAVWAISCFYLRPKARGQGLTHQLVEGGIAHARASGARVLEACPIRQSKDSRSIGLFVGSARVFEKAGFETVVERKAGRPLMRLKLAE